jgi:uncharacterized protein YndB with AHSA1/START domain
MFKTIALVLVVLIAGFLGYVATMPDSFTVVRSATINAPPEKIFPLINDFNQWPQWSPYEKLDPAMQKTLTGPPSGKGAAYEWKGNSDAGSGRIEITEAVEPNKIAMKLDMFEPMEGHNNVEFALVPSGNATEVTWSMQGPSPFASKAMVALGFMDKMVGGQFEEGLSQLKAVAEK